MGKNWARYSISDSRKLEIFLFRPLYVISLILSGTTSQSPSVLYSTPEHIDEQNTWSKLNCWSFEGLYSCVYCNPLLQFFIDDLQNDCDKKHQILRHTYISFCREFPLESDGRRWPALSTGWPRYWCEGICQWMGNNEIWWRAQWRSGGFKGETSKIYSLQSPNRRRLRSINIAMS